MRKPVGRVIPEKPRGSENIIAALRAWPDHREPLIYATSDMPYVGVEAVADFITRARGALCDVAVRVQTLS